MIVSKEQYHDAVAAAPTWTKSTRSDNSGPYCLEVAEVGDAVALRDSTAPSGPVLVFTRREVKAFVDGAKGGEFDHLI